MVLQIHCNTRGHFTRCSHFSSLLRARKNTTQLVKYPRVLSVKPSNKVYVFPLCSSIHVDGELSEWTLRMALSTSEEAAGNRAVNTSHSFSLLSPTLFLLLNFIQSHLP